MFLRQNLSFATLSPIQFNLLFMETQHATYIKVFDITSIVLGKLIQRTLFNDENYHIT